MNQSNHVFEDEKVTVAHSALISMSHLSEEDRSRVLQTLRALAASPPEKWPTDKVHMRLPKKCVYVLDADEQLRVFFRREKDGSLTIVDLALQEMLDYYFSKPLVKE